MKNENLKSKIVQQQPIRQSFVKAEPGRFFSGGFLVALFTAIAFLPMQSGTLKAQNTGQPRSLGVEERGNINVFRQSSPSVVNIATHKAIAVKRGEVNLNVVRLPAGTGSGFLWDENGHVVTNYHVVEGADFVQVKLTDGTEWEAKVLGRAPEFDLAVLKIEAPKARIRPLAIGQSDNLEVGQKVYAIGNPFGLDQTLTTGIVSGLGREIDSRSGEVIRGVVQTDAAINPGNSGGPLLDSQGRLIGVNTAILSRSGSSAGIGFAVPVNTVRATVPLLISGEMVNRGYLGLSLAPLQISRQATEEGVLILGSDEGSPAQKSGLRSTKSSDSGGVVWGDVLISFNGERITQPENLFEKLQDLHAGDDVVVGIKRGQDYSRLTIKLASRPMSTRPKSIPPN